MPECRNAQPSRSPNTLNCPSFAEPTYHPHRVDTVECIGVRVDHLESKECQDYESAGSWGDDDDAGSSWPDAQSELGNGISAIHHHSGNKTDNRSCWG